MRKLTLDYGFGWDLENPGHQIWQRRTAAQWPDSATSYCGSARNTSLGVDATRKLLTFGRRTAAVFEVELGALS
jgi:hypothetical protein